MAAGEFEFRRMAETKATPDPHPDKVLACTKNSNSALPYIFANTMPRRCFKSDPIQLLAQSGNPEINIKQISTALSSNVHVVAKCVAVREHEPPKVHPVSVLSQKTEIIRVTKLPEMK